MLPFCVLGFSVRKCFPGFSRPHGSQHGIDRHGSAPSPTAAMGPGICAGIAKLLRGCDRLSASADHPSRCAGSAAQRTAWRARCPASTFRAGAGTNRAGANRPECDGPAGCHCRAASRDSGGSYCDCRGRCGSGPCSRSRARGRIELVAEPRRCRGSSWLECRHGRRSIWSWSNAAGRPPRRMESSGRRGRRNHGSRVGPRRLLWYGRQLGSKGQSAICL